jgi:hypothetical protein
VTPRDRATLSIDDLRLGGRFLRRLPGFLRHPWRLDEAKAAVRMRLERRGTRFLALVSTAVYQNPGSPYRALLQHAGCTHGDLSRLVEQDGVEGALRALAREGVYLTVEELKGRRPVRRGALTVDAGPARLRNPGARGHLALRSGGGRGAAAAMVVDLDFMRETNANHRVVLAARSGDRWVNAVWDVPGGAALIRVLRLAGIGAGPARWFSQIDPASRDLHPRYRWAPRALRWGSLAAGVPIPAPVHAPLSDPVPVVRWLTGECRAGHVPHVVTTVSAALRLAEAARTEGATLHGVELTISGEPITETRMAALRLAGMRAVPSYGSSDTGTAMGHGCLSPMWPDDMHLFDDLFAVIQPDTSSSFSLPTGALLFTSLGAAAPLILVNVMLGDQAVLVERTCGCAVERGGWTRHLHTVRSFEKLTVGGMNLLDADLIGILDEVLPARFGGAPTHYQLIEEQGPNGQPRLRLLVDPAVGPVDPDAVVEAFLGAVSRGSGMERMTALTWRAGGFVTVERRSPESRRGDKILHLVSRPAGPLPAGERSRTRHAG